MQVCYYPTIPTYTTVVHSLGLYVALPGASHDLVDTLTTMS